MDPKLVRCAYRLKEASIRNIHYARDQDLSTKRLVSQIIKANKRPDGIVSPTSRGEFVKELKTLADSAFSALTGIQPSATSQLSHDINNLIDEKFNDLKQVLIYAGQQGILASSRASQRPALKPLPGLPLLDQIPALAFPKSKIIPASQLTIPQRVAIIIHYAHKYNNGEERGPHLWAGYKMDFAGWTEQHFGEIGGYCVDSLRCALREQGLWVNAHRHIKTSMTLADTLKEKSSPRWQNNENDRGPYDYIHDRQAPSLLGPSAS